MNIQAAIKKVTEKQNLNNDEMTDVMHQIMTGQATDAQIGGFLIGMRMKGETVEEISAAASVMRSLATPVALDKEKLVEIVGTGGDGVVLLTFLPQVVLSSLQQVDELRNTVTVRFQAAPALQMCWKQQALTWR